MKKILSVLLVAVMVLPMVPGGKPIYDMIMKLSEEVMN